MGLSFSMLDEKSLGAHGGGIPPGWDFPEAREAAEQGLDLWLLDSTFRETPTERLRAATGGAHLVQMLKGLRLQKNGA
jgi:hypothetical protein